MSKTKQLEIQELKMRFKVIFPNGTKQQEENFIKANLKDESPDLSNVCNINDPDCLSCGS